MCSSDHLCLEDSKFCDGSTDCGDESDEMFCEDLPCLGSFEKCADQKTCIIVSQKFPCTG